MKYTMKLIFACALIWGTCTQIINAQAPQWNVHANNYQYNMSVTAIVQLDFAPINTEGHVLGAFVNEELRGVATPTIINGGAFYFLTIYANTISEEAFEFKVYVMEEDSIFDAVEFLPFELNGITGSLHNPFEINISLLGDFPISLSPFGNDTTLQGLSFPTVELESQLSSLDDDPILWSGVSSANLSATINGNNELIIAPIDTNWLGSEMIGVIATEAGTNAAFADTQMMTYTILPNYIGPDFTNIPPQFAQENNSFLFDNLNPFIISEGSCIRYEMKVFLMEGNHGDPGWSPPPSNGNAMNLVLQTHYNGTGFNELGTIAGFVNGTLAGKASAIQAGGMTFYFLSLSNVGSGKIDFKYYAPIQDYLYTIPTDISFISGGSIGSASQPKIIDLSPIQISLSQMGEVEAVLKDTTFTDILSVQFKIEDCDFEQKGDSIIVSFAQHQCEMTSIQICPGQSVCAATASDLQNIVWFQDGVAVGRDSIFSIADPGNYYYQAEKMSGSLSIGCLLKVREDVGCIGAFPFVQYAPIEFEFNQDDDFIFETFTTSTMASEMNWTGSGNGSTWHDPMNWDIGVLPCPCQHVIIPTNENVLLESNLTSTIWKLTTLNGAVLTLGMNSELAVIGK